MTGDEMVMYVVEDLSMRDQAWSSPFVYNNLLMKVEERQREKAYHCRGLFDQLLAGCMLLGGLFEGFYNNYGRNNKRGPFGRGVLFVRSRFDAISHLRTWCSFTTLHFIIYIFLPLGRIMSLGYYVNM